MGDTELDTRLRQARAIAGEVLRSAMQGALREAGVLEPVGLDEDGEMQRAVCRSAALGAMEFGDAARAPAPLLGPLGRSLGVRIADVVAAVLRGEGS